MKTEWHPCLAALAVQVGDPFEVERTGMFARFATHRYLFDQLGVEIGVRSMRSSMGATMMSLCLRGNVMNNGRRRSARS